MRTATAMKQSNQIQDRYGISNMKSLLQYDKERIENYHKANVLKKQISDGENIGGNILNHSMILTGVFGFILNSSDNISISEVVLISPILGSAFGFLTGTIHSFANEISHEKEKANLLTVNTTKWDEIYNYLRKMPIFEKSGFDRSYTEEMKCCTAYKKIVDAYGQIVEQKGLDQTSLLECIYAADKASKVWSYDFNYFDSTKMPTERSIEAVKELHVALKGLLDQLTTNLDDLYVM